MDLGIEGRLALVTGASKNIGRAIAEELARQGARVIITARTRQQLELVRAGMFEPGRHHVLVADLQTEAGLTELKRGVDEIGPIEMIVHNLGGSAGVFGYDAPVADWQRVWQYNVGTVVDLNNHFVPGMVDRKWGRIVHLSTLSTVTFQGNSAYVSAKCALDGYVKNWSRSVSQHNVILSAVSPGAIHAEGRGLAKLQEDPAALAEFFDNHLPTRRVGQGSDVANAVAFLCSEQAAFMAGAIIAVDGGGH